MATASDNFNRTENPLSTGWTNFTGGNRAAGTVAGTTGAFAGNVSGYSGETWTGDHESDVVLTTLDASDTDARGVGPAVRCQTVVSSRYAYCLKVSQAGSKIVLMGAGDTDTDLASNATTWANGDTGKLRAVGTTLTAYKNGAELFSVTDSALSGGVPGIQMMRAGTALDSWAGADVAGGGAQPPRSMHQFRMRSAA